MKSRQVRAGKPRRKGRRPRESPAASVRITVKGELYMKARIAFVWLALIVLACEARADSISGGTPH